MSLPIIPNASQPTTVRNTDYAPAAPSAPGLTDSFRSNGAVSVASQINNRHPIESRILSWEATQTKMKMETHRRMFGMADPVKREMELAIVENSEFVPTVLGSTSHIHSDILRNKDWSVDWEDIYSDHTSSGLINNNIHTQMESRLNI